MVLSSPWLHHPWMQPSLPLAKLAMQNHNSLARTTQETTFISLFFILFPFHLVRKGCYGPHSWKLHALLTRACRPTVTTQPAGFVFFIFLLKLQTPSIFSEEGVLHIVPFSFLKKNAISICLAMQHWGKSRGLEGACWGGFGVLSEEFFRLLGEAGFQHRQGKFG